MSSWVGCAGLISHEKGWIILAGCSITGATACLHLGDVSVVRKVQTTKPLVPPRRFYPMSHLASTKKLQIIT